MADFMFPESIDGAAVQWDERTGSGLALAVAVCVSRHLFSHDVLAVQRREDVGIVDPPRLCMPGGRIELGEHPRIAACRETLEETGMVLHQTDLEWLGAIDVESRRGGVIVVAVYWAMAPFTYVPGPGKGEPLMAPRWVPLDDLCDPRHERFAGPAKLARMVRRG
jgi:8-oxo-dGTP pyrophosphatase MutT (NUDIX family)